MNKKTLAILVILLILVVLAGWFLSADDGSVDVTVEPSATTVFPTEISTDAPSITSTPFPTAEPTIDYDY
jgi:hypothetical protein